MLDGARHITIAGHYAYIAADAGLVVVDLDDPLQPRLVATVPLPDARALGAAVPLPVRRPTPTGCRSIDVTDPDDAAARRTAHACRSPTRARIYVARTYAYVAAGQRRARDRRRRAARAAARSTRSSTPTASSNDARDVVVGIDQRLAVRLRRRRRERAEGGPAHLARHPAQVLRLRPEPKPQLIAWRTTASPALALSKGLDRDRAVDETGDQIAVFGRLGSRPFNLDEMKRFYLQPDGSVFTVTDEVRMQEFVLPDQRRGIRRRQQRGTQ